MFRVVGDWDDGKGSVKAKQDKISGTSSPLLGQPAKKKISLLDYKKKAAGQPSAETPPPKVENEAKLLRKVNGSSSLTEIQKQEKPEGNKEESHGVKR